MKFIRGSATVPSIIQREFQLLPQQNKPFRRNKPSVKYGGARYEFVKSTHNRNGYYFAGDKFTPSLGNYPDCHPPRNMCLYIGGAGAFPAMIHVYLTIFMAVPKSVALLSYLKLVLFGYALWGEGLSNVKRMDN